MARARNIKPGFFANPELVELPFATRLLFIGLWTVADRAGRLEDGGERFIQILAFDKHQHPHKDEKQSIIPAPCEHHAATVQGSSGQDGNPAESLSLDSLSPDSLSTADAAPTEKTRKTRLPKDFAISSRVEAWAKAQGFGRLDEHLEAFKRKASAKGYSYIDWDAAYMEAIREDWAKLRGRTPNGAPAAAESKTTPLDPKTLYKPEPALTPEQLAINRANAAAQLEKLKRGGLAAIREGAH
jgi:hypothetical protein